MKRYTKTVERQESPLEIRHTTGYVRVYRSVVDDCGMMPAMLYGVIEDMIQIGSRTGLVCVMSHTAFADQMGVSARAVRNYLVTLRDAGWLDWEEQERGGTNRYFLIDKIVVK